MLVAAAEAAAESGNNPLISFNPGLMIWTLVTFFIAMAVLRAKVFGPMQSALDARRKAIVESVEAAERTRDEASKLLADYKQQLADARTEGEAIIDRARKVGDEVSARMTAEAEAHRQQAITQTQQQVTSEVEKAMGDLRVAVAEMTVTASEKVLRGSLDQGQHQRLIEQAVEELDFSRLEKVGAGS